MSAGSSTCGGTSSLGPGDQGPVARHLPGSGDGGQHGFDHLRGGRRLLVQGRALEPKARRAPLRTERTTLDWLARLDHAHDAGGPAEHGQAQGHGVGAERPGRQPAIGQGLHRAVVPEGVRRAAPRVPPRAASSSRTRSASSWPPGRASLLAPWWWSEPSRSSRYRRQVRRPEASRHHVHRPRFSPTKMPAPAGTLV